MQMVLFSITMRVITMTCSLNCIIQLLPDISISIYLSIYLSMYLSISISILSILYLSASDSYLPCLSIIILHV